jgi:hypothetical protein
VNVRTRSASEWREFWATRGERELTGLLGDLAPHATRIATLLGSRAPKHALAAELGRIRNGPPDDELAHRIHDWFANA